MERITRRTTLGLGAGLLSAGVAGQARAAGGLPLGLEAGASLHVLRPSPFVDSDRLAFEANSRKFADLHNIAVRVEYASWEDLRPQTAVTANTGAGPDVVVGWTDDPHLYSDKILDLTDVAGYLGAKYGGWYPLAERYGKKSGVDSWIAIPMGGCGFAAVYRESWLREAGYDRFPADTDGFLDLCRRLQANGHPAGFSTGHAVGDANFYCHWLVWAFGGAMVDEDQHVIINSKETIEALRYGKALYETFIPGTQFWIDPSNNAALIAGEIGLTANSVGLYVSVKNASDPRIAALAGDINHARMPVGPVGHATEVALAINAMVFKHTRYPNAAKAYLAFMMEAPQYDHWLDDSSGYWTQPLKAYAGNPVWTRDLKIAAFRDTMQDSLWLGYKGAISMASGAAAADYVMVDMVAAVNSGESTPEDAAREAERRARRYYKA